MSISRVHIPIVMWGSRQLPKSFSTEASNSSLLMTVRGQEREVDLGLKISTYLYIYNVISNAYLCAIVPAVFDIYTIYIMSICLNPESDICECFGGRQVENSE